MPRKLESNATVNTVSNFSLMAFRSLIETFILIIATAIIIYINSDK